MGMGLHAKVDDEDYEWLSRQKWSVTGKKRGGARYAVRGVTSRGYRITISMHSLITGYAMTDHIDGDGLNNQRANLRETTPSRNLMNRPRSAWKGHNSRFKGVVWRPEIARWQVSVKRHPVVDAHRKGHGHQVKLGCYDTEEEAARVRDNAVRVREGPDQTHNFPRPGERSAVDGTVAPGDPALLSWGFDYLAENPGMDWGGPPTPLPPGVKECPRCDKVLPVQEFGPNGCRRDGLQNYCYSCSRVVGRDSYHKTKKLLYAFPKPLFLKECPKCGLVREFGRNKKSVDGLQHYCLQCGRDYARDKRALRKLERSE